MTSAKKIKIIDYKAGNAPSVLHAVQRLGFQAEFAAGPGDLENAACIILPGVGSAGATMDSLSESGLTDALNEYVINKQIPFLGVCVGLQILFEHSEEDDALCFGWLKGRVKRFDSALLRVPQMGWNKVSFVNDTPVNALYGAAEGYFYFVNSYYAKPEEQSDIWGKADYGGDFTAAVRRGNIYGTQFHIEKSGEAGLKLLRGFLQSC
ncbi:MAG: imidazole glycerol phosphate synthase subunit HisH [Treponema sp.]|nr:imidazole glycerol phosphate synthase subunit HisH [Treponema sp.]